jgi:O-antigen/teichoic acid export membrane protein
VVVTPSLPHTSSKPENGSEFLLPGEADKGGRWRAGAESLRTESTIVKALYARLGALGRSVQFRSIGVLVSGTAVAHGITALAMPISTRLYSPTDFAAATVFSSLVGILVVASCLRFEMAIPLPADDEEAVNLLALSFGSIVATSAVAGIVLCFLPHAVLASFGQPELIPYFWLLPLALFIGGLNLALQMWFVRRKGFGAIARSRVVQSTGAAGAQLGLGAAGIAPLGLLVGQMLNYGAGAITLGLGLLMKERAVLSRISLSGMRSAARTHHRFPRYSIWEALANSAAIHLPILLIAAVAPGPEAGFLALAIFLLQAPMALIGTSVGQVYLSGAPEALREGRLAVFTEDMMVRLIQLSAGPLLFAAIVSPTAFGLIFGHQWDRSGVLVAWMAPWFLMQFISSPVSTVLNVTGHQFTALVLQMSGLVLRVGVVLAASVIQPTIVVEAYALSGFVFYFAYLVVAARAAGVHSPALAMRALSATPVILISLILAGVVYAILQLLPA